jgi:geranylgeranyl pyrophosphate synthase
MKAFDMYNFPLNFQAFLLQNYSIKLWYKLFYQKKDDILEIAGICEILHNGSLIIDDIEDDRFLN